MKQENNDTSEVTAAFVRHFGLMIRAAEPAFLLTAPDEANHTAKGLLDGGTGHLHRAFLSFEGQRKRIRILVVLRLTGDLSPIQRRVLEQLQATSSMCRFDADSEERQLKLQACSVCTQPEQPKFVIEQLLQDIQQILADDRLAVVVDR